MANTKRALLTSALAIVACVAMLIGSTFAWFTDTASTGVNKIQAGNLDVKLEYKNADTKAFAEAKADTKVFDESALWEPGHVEYVVLRLSNVGSLALKYELGINIASEKGSINVGGDAFKLSDYIKFAVIDEDQSGLSRDNLVAAAAGKGAVLNAGYTAEDHLLKDGAKTVTLVVWMPTTVGNEANHKTDAAAPSIELGINVFATQYTEEYDSFDDQYDKDAGTAHYTLAEFNALTEIPEDVKAVYLDIGDVSLKDSGVTIGNKSMADVYTGVTGDYYIGQELDDGRVVTSVWNASTKTYLANTNKSGITLYISGSVNDNNEGGLLSSDPHAMSIVIPDASNVVFTKDFTVNGYFRCFFSWNDSQKLGGGVAAHKIQSVLFDHSTFNGIWIQNGGFLADSLTLDGCTFSAYTNKVAPNDSNPMWFCNTGSCDITVKNCSFTASRPIKLAEQSTSGTKLMVVNNTFDMGVENSANKEGEPKNDAIMLCAIGNGTLGDVVISGNKAENATALLAFYRPAGFTMAEGASFTVSGNTLGDGVQLGVVWKSATAYTPGFVTVK